MIQNRINNICIENVNMFILLSNTILFMISLLSSKIILIKFKQW